MFGDAGKHFGADLDAIVEGEDEIRMFRVGKDFMGAGSALELPAEGKESLEDFFRLCGAPLAHAARLKTSERKVLPRGLR